MTGCIEDTLFPLAVTPHDSSGRFDRVRIRIRIVPGPMGIASVGPGVDLAILSCAIAFRQHRGKCGQIALDLYKISLRDLVPLCFEWCLELSPKRFELLLIHPTLLPDMVN